MLTNIATMPVTKNLMFVSFHTDDKSQRKPTWDKKEKFFRAESCARQLLIGHLD